MFLMVVKSVAYVCDPSPIGVVTPRRFTTQRGQAPTANSYVPCPAGRDVGSFRVFRWRFVAGYSAAGQSVVGTDGS